MRGGAFLAGILILSVISAKSQYFYKDIVLTRQNQANWNLYHKMKVRDVNIQSLDATGQPSPNFECTQNVSSDFTIITTFTKSADVPASTLLTNYDKSGRLVKTTDTSDTYRATTEYTYDEQGDIVSLNNVSQETDNHITASEKHIWFYENGKPKRMIKIKENTDTTIVNLILDEFGNVIEEKPVRKQQSLPSVYYYYDNDNRLTDIVRYNEKAARLLPDYVFEYNYDRISSMLFVPPGSADYQKWIYTYNANGLKKNDSCFDKKKNLIVRVNYSYSFQ